MLVLKDYSLSLDTGRQILMGISFTFPGNQTTLILGKNGSGKSSLVLSLLGHPKYQVEGTVQYNTTDMTHMSPDARQALGLFLSFQNVPEIPGIRVHEYLRTIYNAHFHRQFIDKKSPTPFVFRRMLQKLLPGLGLDEDFLERELYVGFSGGEKRRLELLQIALLDPSCIILDEIDAGLDIDAVEILIEHIRGWQSVGKIIILITHNFTLLQSIHIDHVIVLDEGRLKLEGGRELIDQIGVSGF